MPARKRKDQQTAKENDAAHWADLDRRMKALLSDRERRVRVFIESVGGKWPDIPGYDPLAGQKRLPPEGTKAYWRELDRMLQELLNDKERRIRVWRECVGWRADEPVQ
ncbi:MAG TPA: hypothetical protein VJ397_08835 [Thermoplasmata archaeon]|nr:hypothetical protein [Thermoplasmata archaeon]